LAAQPGRFLCFGGQSDLGGQRIEAALEMAENLELPEVLGQSRRAPLLGEARERLRATPWLERYDALGVGATTAA
jgi:hypothetical protein